MEEIDELVPHPDSDGVLNLTHRAWVLLDSVIWTMRVYSVASWQKFMQCSVCCREICTDIEAWYVELSSLSMGIIGRCFGG